MITAWRITKQKHTRNAFSGAGAKTYGGRWNSPGNAVVYTAESRALALLEILANLDTPSLLSRYVLIRVEFPQKLVTEIAANSLPKNWAAKPAASGSQTLGDEWIASGRSPVLQVPSAIVAGESNFLLNPQHPAFPQLKMFSAERFTIDPRLSR